MIKQGTYKLVKTGAYIYVKHNDVLVIDTYGINLLNARHFDRFTEADVKPISYNTFYDEYKKVLGKADDILGTRGRLIKPEEISMYFEVDEFDRIKPKYDF